MHGCQQRGKDMPCVNHVSAKQKGPWVIHSTKVRPCDAYYSGRDGERVPTAFAQAPHLTLECDDLVKRAAVGPLPLPTGQRFCTVAHLVEKDGRAQRVRNQCEAANHDAGPKSEISSYESKHGRAALVTFQKGRTRPNEFAALTGRRSSTVAEIWG